VPAPRDFSLPEKTERALHDLPTTGRVLVAVSGGVDSSVAAWILKRRGMEVIGATIRLFAPDDPALQANGFCSSESAVAGSEEICDMLGIRHRIIDGSVPFRDEVLGPFAREYAAGRTPNPCVLCNAGVKWTSLWDAARRMDCAYVATGHYARTRRSPGVTELLRPLDRTKDQTYALYRLSCEALSGTLFPLGGMLKENVRAIARDLALPCWDLPESQDICFLPRGALSAYLSKNTNPVPGPVVDLQDNVLGTHDGLPLYTIGQRKGLGIPYGEPIYVIRKDLDRNLLVVGTRKDLCRLTFPVENVNWLTAAPPPRGTTMQVQVELRFRSRPIEGQVTVESDRNVSVSLVPHQQAVAPGQSAVWYQGDLLLGGGIIGGPG
jgi:tRNA-specific 2-thiouridylase